jgi:CheY-like chemotaxis protein
VALKSVLVADDSRICRVLTREMLRDHQLHVFEAADGKEALELMVTYRPELVILDLLMPRLSGFEVLLKLAERVPEYKPVIFVFTAVFKSRRWESETRHNYEIHEYLEKSLEPTELLAAITRHFPEFNSSAKPAPRLPQVEATPLATARPLLS